ncbi:MAG: DNA polymerase III subunit delta [Aquificaceae bacterium]|jgi:DNA polymerase-3 subunit delta|uniref:DNA polymerase III subunit delta n=1 Tax=Hydrogenobacter sp. Uz 6-8 TaxID=3384828 RepID=UPI000F2496D3|nr:MAG: DNA polymerase III subunit delta [Aquificota bacterium]
MNLLEYQKGLEKRQIKAVNLIHGEEEYVVKTFLDRLRELMPTRILWGDELTPQDLVRAVSTSGMFTGEEALFLYRAEELFKSIKDYRTFISYLERVRGKKVFFYVGYKLTEKDLQKEPFLSLSKLGDVLYAGKLDRRRVRELVKNKLLREGIGIEEEALEYLLDATSYQLMTLKGETDKLILYGKKHITLEDVKAIVLADWEMGIFDFVDAVFFKDYEKALNSLTSILRSGTHPLQILTLLVNYTIKLYTAKVLVEGGQDLEKALSEVDVRHRFQVMNFKKYIAENSSEELRSLLRRLYLLDMGIKVYYADPAQALREFVIEYILHEEGPYYPADTGDQNRADSEP